jgi:hypothetical protein
MSVVQILFAFYSRKQKQFSNIGRSSDLLPYLNAFPIFHQWHKCVQHVWIEFTAAGTVPDFNRIPFLPEF